MDVSVIKIGNSKGIRLSKTLLEKYGIHDRVELILKQESIVIKPIARPREGWGKRFKEMTENGDDSLLVQDIFEEDDFEEWN